MTEPYESTCLAIDATNRWIVAGIFGASDSQFDQEFCLEAPRDSFRLLVPTIQDLLRRAGISRPDWIATTVGPGSFTGTRISVSAARNLAQLWDIPVRPVDSLRYYLYSQAREIEARDEPRLAVMIDAKQERVYARVMRPGEVLSESATPVQDVPPARFLAELPADSLLFADDPDSIAAYLPANHDPGAWPRTKWSPLAAPRARYLRELCARLPALDWRALEPRYIRNDPATHKFPGGLPL